MSQQINLFNPVFLKQKKYFSAVTMAQALGLILLGTLLVSGYGGYQLAALKRHAVATSQQLVATQALAAKVDAEYGIRQKSKALEQDIQVADAEVLALRQVFAVLEKGEFGNTKGYSEYLRAFSRQIVPGVWLTGFSIYGAGNEIGLQGRALQPDAVPAYVNRLRREPVMHGKSFSTLEMQVPQVDAPLRASNASTSAAQAATASAAPHQVAAPYIEFTLLSQGLHKDAAATPGAANK